MELCKFRAWDKENKRFVYFCNGTYYIKSDCDLLYRCSKNIFDWSNAEQYTGLKDNTKWKNLTEKEREAWTRYGGLPSKFDGKEIYEGDIIESKYRNWKMIIKIGRAKYIGCGIELYGVYSEFLNSDKKPEPFMYNSGRFDFEIIGNIHENKDLLNE